MGSVKKIGGEMLTKSYKIRSLINLRIQNEPTTAVAVEGPLLEVPFSPAEQHAHRVSEVTKVIKAR